MMQDVKCPYCGEWQEINHNDGRGYKDGVTNSQTCSDCEKEFCFTTEISFSYDAFKAPCLNEESEHNYQLANTCPREFSQMECSICGDVRDLTDEERAEYGIGSISDYFDSLEN